MRGMLAVVIAAILFVVLLASVGTQTLKIGADQDTGFNFYVTPDKDVRNYAIGETVTWKMEVLEVNETTKTISLGKGHLTVSYSYLADRETLDGVAPLTHKTAPLTRGGEFVFSASYTPIGKTNALPSWNQRITIIPSAHATTDINPPSYVITSMNTFTANEPIKGVTSADFYMVEKNTEEKVPANVMMIGMEAMLAPVSPLKYDTEYTVYVGAGVTDLAGNPLPTASWSFKTDPDRLAPTFAITTPYLTWNGYTFNNQYIQSAVHDDTMSINGTNWLEIKGVANDESGISKVSWRTHDASNRNQDASGPGYAYSHSGNSTTWYADVLRYPHWSAYYTIITIIVEDNAGNIASRSFACANEVGSLSLATVTITSPCEEGNSFTTSSNKVNVVGLVTPVGGQPIKKVIWDDRNEWSGQGSGGYYTYTHIGDKVYSSGIAWQGTSSVPLAFNFTVDLINGVNVINVTAWDNGNMPSYQWIWVTSTYHGDERNTSDNTTAATDTSTDIVSFAVLAGALLAFAGVFLSFAPGIPDSLRTIGHVSLFIGAVLLVICGFLTLSKPTGSVGNVVAMLLRHT